MVAQWSDAIAIVPLNPVTEGHIILIPRQHVSDALEDPGVTARMMFWASAYAKAPCNIITSVGALATQSIRHLHLHIVPRRLDDGLVLPWGDNGRQSREHRDNAYAFYNGGTR